MASRCRLVGAQPERMTDGIRQLGSVQGVKVKLVDTLQAKMSYLLYGNACGDHLPRLRIVFQS